jgi:hypothetical protein
MMRTPISLIALSAACLLAGCATAYQPDGVSGGYSDKVLAGNTVQVTFRGNRLTSAEMVHSFLLRRCAEVTLQDGYNYFVLAHEEDPNEGNTDAFGSKVSTATIEMYQGRPQGDARAYDASSLLREVLAQEGESEEPPPVAVATSANPEMPPPIPGAGQPSNIAANGNAASSSASHLLLANPNPNALTNEPLHFNQW